jgi:uncharacterized membrane protein YfhO
VECVQEDILIRCESLKEEFEILKDRNFDNGIRKVTITTRNGLIGENVILSQLNYPKLHVKSQGGVQIIQSKDQASNSYYVLDVPAGENSIEIEWKPPFWEFSYTINFVNYLYWFSLFINSWFRLVKRNYFINK